VLWRTSLTRLNNTRLDFLPNEPKNYRESLKRPDRGQWAKAEQVEYDTLVKHGTWELVDEPSDRVISLLPSKWVYKLKLDQHGNISRYKSRLVLLGNLQNEDQYSDTFSPTARLSSIRTLISIAAQERLDLTCFDIESAFVQADVDHEIYIRPPPGYSFPPGKVARLRRSLYGLRQASRLFHAKLHTFLLAYGFQQVGEDGTLFRFQSNDDVLFLSMYVDDGLVASSSPQLYQKFMCALKTEFTISNESPLQYYLGIAFTRDRDGSVFLDQSKYIRELLERFGMQDSSPEPTPLAPNQHLNSDDCCDQYDPEMRQRIQTYQSLISALLWLSTATRPNIAYATNQLALYLTNPGHSHFVAAKRVLRYLKGTQELGLRYSRSEFNGNVLTAYCDSDFAGDPDDRRSVTGYIMFLNGGPVVWSSKRQPIVSVSSSEAEFYAASLASLDVLFYRRLLADLGFEQTSPTVMWEDNAACIYMSQKEGILNRAKHIDLRVHRIRELVRDRVVVLTKVATLDQVADAFTKSLNPQLFCKHRSMFMSLPSSS